MVVVVPQHPCHTPVKGKTTPNFRNSHHIKQHLAHLDAKKNSNRLENFSQGISVPEKTIPQLSVNSVVRLLRYNPPGTKNPRISGIQVTLYTLILSHSSTPQRSPSASSPHLIEGAVLPRILRFSIGPATQILQNPARIHTPAIATS